MYIYKLTAIKKIETCKDCRISEKIKGCDHKRYCILTNSEVPIDCVPTWCALTLEEDKADKVIDYTGY